VSGRNRGRGNRNPADPLFVELAELSRFLRDLYRSAQKAKAKQERAVQLRQIAAVERQVNELVYELYGLTDEERMIVDDALHSPGPLAEHAEVDAVGV
jgi:hypothetical protein